MQYVGNTLSNLWSDQLDGSDRVTSNSGLPGSPYHNLQFVVCGPVFQFGSCQWPHFADPITDILLIITSIMQPFFCAKSCFSSKVSSHWYDGPMSHSWELTLNLVCCDRDHRLRGGTTIWVTLPWLTPILQGWCHLGNSNQAQWICTHFLCLSSRPCKLIVRSAQWIFSVLHITINALQQHLMLFELEEAGIRVCDLDHIYPPSSTFD